MGRDDRRPPLRAPLDGDIPQRVTTVRPAAIHGGGGVRPQDTSRKLEAAEAVCGDRKPWRRAVRGGQGPAREPPQ